jgi:RNA polymerase sigma-70 factor (ECF subfamily)
MASFSDAGLDARTARALQQGDRSAQETAYRVLAPTVMAMAQRLLQDRGLAQEVVQDTFVELIERGHTLQTPEAVVGWVRKVAVNHCLMRVRSPWHKRRVQVDPDEGADSLADGERMEGMQDVERALAALGPEARMVVWLHDVEGYTHKEIGALLGRTTSYSKSQLARGYEKLLTRFGGNDERHDDTAIRPACSS